MATSGGNGQEIRMAIKEMEQDCELLWKDVQKVFNQLQLAQKPSSTTGENTQLDTLYCKEKALKAEIEVYGETKPKALPLNQVIQEELLLSELKTSVSELEEVLTVIKSKHDDVKGEVKRNTVEIEEHEFISEELTKKIEQHRNYTPQQLNEQSVLNEMSTKRKSASTYRKKMMGQMAAFIHKHFPPPSNEQLERSRKTRRGTDGQSIDNRDIQSLQNILEELMNLCIEQPHDPYLNLDETHWPPYIALLVRVGIAVKHPNIDSKIKLIPFHL